MGAAMASRLLPAGYSVTVYGRTPSKAAPLLSLGGRLADSPFAVAQSSKWQGRPMIFGGPVRKLKMWP
ncbi:unnamed protein product [Linum tenue]|uniref:6-phosphogluconate dehydrogenase NADP-binding domain-containing protein n=1 Tax=Linum tenue TaxID=586396 RepID=A0AAV0GR01_9ROSI|nr:unnamed protein product [Linum tenue]